MNLGGIKVNYVVLYTSCFSKFLIFFLRIYITQTSSIEIERVCDQADECLSETAAVSITPPNGGPELLAIFAVLKEGFKKQSEEELKRKFSRAIQKDLNPLFKVSNSFGWFQQIRSTKSFLLLNNGFFFFAKICRCVS